MTSKGRKHGAAGEAAPLGGREAILVAAVRMFAVHGVDGVSMRQIAREAKVSLGLIWKHFGPKEALREAVDEHVISVLDRENEHILTVQGKSGTAALTAEHGRPVSEYVWELRYLRRALLDGNAASMKMFKRYFDVGQKFFAHLKTSGEIREDVDDDLLTMTSIYIALGPLLLEPYCQSVFGVDIFDQNFTARREDFYKNLLMNGVGARK